MDGAALTQRGLTGCGVCKPHEGEVDDPGVVVTGESCGSYTGGNNRGPDWGDSVGASVVRRAVQRPTAWSSPARNGSEPSQDATELGFPGPALGKMQGGTPRLAGDAFGQGFLSSQK